MKRNKSYLNEDIKVYKASDFVNEHEAFVKIVSNAYNITDDACTSYLNYFKWYWEKVVPNILKGTRDVIIVTVNGEMAGVTIVKKEDKERKLCTIFVIPEYRDRKITTKLLEESFAFLETTTPLVTISEDKLDMFQGIIKKYNWKETQVLPKGYYNDTYKEIVFNGFIN